MSLTIRYLRKELLHFSDGTIADHTSQEVERIDYPEHEAASFPSGWSIWLVPASDQYVQSWRDINPAIRNVTFSYTRLQP